MNVIELTEKNGKGKIKIDGVDINGMTKYEIKRDTNIAEITITINVPPENLKTNVIP